jgi:D-sedoheptulose 7-phosphate isomerase
MSEQDNVGAKVGLRVAEAVAHRHPGPTYDNTVRGTVVEITARHPAHEWKFGLDLANPDHMNDPVKHGMALAMRHLSGSWAMRLDLAIRASVVTSGSQGEERHLSDGLSVLLDVFDGIYKNSRGSKIIFVGNGGSSAIAGHMAEDFTKNGKMRAVSFGDPALLTCYANDYGWDCAYAKMVMDYADPGDVVIGISSSGNSMSILGAMSAAGERGCKTVTFSGFSPDNALRKAGHLNFYTPARQYGFVETAHAAILHMALDIHGGWVGQS